MPHQQLAHGPDVAAWETDRISCLSKNEEGSKQKYSNTLLGVQEQTKRTSTRSISRDAFSTHPSYQSAGSVAIVCFCLETQWFFNTFAWTPLLFCFSSENSMVYQYDCLARAPRREWPFVVTPSGRSSGALSHWVNVHCVIIGRQRKHMCATCSFHSLAAGALPLIICMCALVVNVVVDFCDPKTDSPILMRHATYFLLQCRGRSAADIDSE